MEERFCEHVIFLVHAPLRVYDKHGNREKIYVDYGEQIDLLEADAEYKDFLLQKKKIDSPILYTEQQHIIYGIIGGKEHDYILGPCCLDGKPVTAVCNLLQKHKISQDTVYRIGCTGLMEFGEVVIMLYEMITGRKFDREQLWVESFADAKMEQGIGGHKQKVFYERQEEAVLHNPYSQDKREQDSIKKGDMEGLYKSFQEAYPGKVGRLASDEVRSQKNLAIGVIAVSCRSAIEGGVIPEIAFSLSDAYIRQVEETAKEGEPFAVSRKAEVNFCRMVNEGQKSGKQSPVVVRCKELILKYLHSKLSAKVLSEELDVTPGYLSQIFAKEEGITLTEYIAREKIKFAKDQLIYTEDSYEKIAYTYGFSSQSHFGSVFKKLTNMTPGEFREKYRI